MFADITSPVLLAIAAGIAGLIAIVLVFVIRFLQSHISVEAFTRLRGVAEQAVAAVEQKWLAGEIQKDLRYIQACEYIRTVFPNITDIELEQAINSAVLLITKQVTAGVKPEAKPIIMTPQSQGAPRIIRQVL